eukprot:2248083-Rhodomonas_salina.4
MSTHFGTTNYIGHKTPAYPEGGRIVYVEQGDRAGLKKGDVQTVLHSCCPSAVDHPCCHRRHRSHLSSHYRHHTS